MKTSNRLASGREGDTLIDAKIQGGFDGFGYKHELLNWPHDTLTFNQVVAGSRPARPTKANKPTQ